MAFQVIKRLLVCVRVRVAKLKPATSTTKMVRTKNLRVPVPGSRRRLLLPQRRSNRLRQRTRAHAAGGAGHDSRPCERRVPRGDLMVDHPVTASWLRLD